MGNTFHLNACSYCRRKNGIRTCFYFVSSILSPFLYLLTHSCFVTSADNNAWIIAFFFVPVCLCVIAGLLLFILSLIKLTYFAIRLRKFKDVVFTYLRVLLFILVFLVVYTLFCAYTINDATNASAIISGYEQYYECVFNLSDLLSTPGTCTLNSDVSNYPLVMLKGFAISCVGFTLFWIFLSKPLVMLWVQLAIALYQSLRSCDRTAVMQVFMVVGLSTASTSASSFTLKGTTNMTMGELEPEEEDEEEDEEEQPSTSTSEE